MHDVIMYVLRRMYINCFPHNDQRDILGINSLNFKLIFLEEHTTQNSITHTRQNFSIFHIKFSIQSKLRILNF